VPVLAEGPADSWDKRQPDRANCASGTAPAEALAANCGISTVLAASTVAVANPLRKAESRLARPGKPHEPQHFARRFADFDGQAIENI
jgi:hypothetical protein